MISRIPTAAIALLIFIRVIAPAVAQEAATPEAPSAELIIDDERAITPEPPREADEEPLPLMDGGSHGALPGEENIFGDDLFKFPGSVSAPSEPVIPDRPPLLEDPKEAERKLRVQFRKVKATLDPDPELLALQELADKAPTPEDHRAARRAYYALFFSKVRKADPKLSDYADRLEKSSLVILTQTRITPTIPLNPPPQPQPRPDFFPPPEYPPAVTQPAAIGDPAPLNQAQAPAIPRASGW